MGINTHLQFFFALFAGLMIAFSIWHSRSLYLAFIASRNDQTEQSKRFDKFFSRQYRRRLQIWLLIGCAGVFILFGVYVSPQKNLTLFVVVWILAMVSLSWTVLIALIDAISINLFYATFRNEDMAQQAKKRHILTQKAQERLEQLKTESRNTDSQESVDENTPDG